MALFGSLAYFIAQRTLWLGRANSAWGPSRVWSSGASWETDANNAWGASRVYGSGLSFEQRLPPASIDHLAASGTANSDGVLHNPVASLSLDRGGNWLIVFAGDNQPGGGSVNVTGFVGGVQVATTGGTPNSTAPIAVAWQGGVTLPSTITVAISGSGGTGTPALHGYIDAFFIPTAANPN
jgi:hypothetical protein